MLFAHWKMCILLENWRPSRESLLGIHGWLNKCSGCRHFWTHAIPQSPIDTPLGLPPALVSLPRGVCTTSVVLWSFHVAWLLQRSFVVRLFLHGNVALPRTYTTYIGNVSMCFDCCSGSFRHGFRTCTLTGPKNWVTLLIVMSTRRVAYILDEDWLPSRASFFWYKCVFRPHTDSARIFVGSHLAHVSIMCSCYCAGVWV